MAATMDNVTHTLFALTLARTPLARAGRGTAVALVLASNAPDIDIVATARRRGELPDVAPRPDPRPARASSGSACVVAALVWIARRAAAAGDRAATTLGRAVRACSSPIVGDRRAVPRADGSADVVRHPPPQSVRLALVRRRLDADRRRLPAGGARGRSAVRQIVGGGAAPERRHRPRADGGQLRRPRRRAPSGARRSRRGCSARCCRRAAIRRPRDGAASTRWPRAASRDTAPAGTRCLVELVALPTFLSPFKWRVIAHLSNAYEMHDVDLLDGALPAAADRRSEALWRTTLRYPERVDAGRSGRRRRRSSAGRSSGSPAFRPPDRSSIRTARRRSAGTTCGSSDARRRRPRPTRLPRDRLFTAIVASTPDGQVARRDSFVT